MTTKNFKFIKKNSKKENKFTMITTKRKMNTYVYRLKTKFIIYKGTQITERNKLKYINKAQRTLSTIKLNHIVIT